MKGGCDVLLSRGLSIVQPPPRCSLHSVRLQWTVSHGILVYFDRFSSFLLCVPHCRNMISFAAHHITHPKDTTLADDSWHGVPEFNDTANPDAPPLDKMASRAIIESSGKIWVFGGMRSQGRFSIIWRQFCQFIVSEAMCFPMFPPVLIFKTNEWCLFTALEMISVLNLSSRLVSCHCSAVHPRCVKERLEYLLVRQQRP